MDREYGGIIWTNHALDRLVQRGIKQGDAWATWRRPDSSKYEEKKGIWVYRRNFNGESVEVVAKKNDKGKWIVLSVWSKDVGRSASDKVPLIKRIIQRMIKGF